MIEGDVLVDAVRQVYEANRHVVSVDPEFLANGAMTLIAFDKRLHPVGWVGCNLHCRQLARAFCRRNFDPADKDKSQGDLFSDALQDRYPARPRRGHEPEYILRDHLGEDDRWYNVDRLRSAAAALLRHATALESETLATYGPRKDRAA